MKTRTLINTVIAAAIFLPGWNSVRAVERQGSVSASIQATARVVPSLGLAVSPIEISTPELEDDHDWWLWISDNEDLQVQVQTDGLRGTAPVLIDASDLSDLSILERHRHNGLKRHRLQIGSPAEGVTTFTVTIVNPAN